MRLTHPAIRAEGRAISLTWQGQEIPALEGETVAASLSAAGIATFRATASGAPRGLHCGMGACQGRICGAAAQVLYGWAPQPARHLLSPARLSTLASAAPDFIHEPMTESTSKA